MIKHLRKFIFIPSIILLFSNINILNAATDDLLTSGAEVIPITRLSLAFIETQGTILEDFDEQKAQVEKFVSKYGIDSSKVFILYLDVEIENINRENYATNINKELTIEYLEERFGKPTLRFKRKAVVGVIYNSAIPVSENDTVRTITLTDTKALTTQTIDRLEIEDGQSHYLHPNRIFDRMSMLKHMNLRHHKNKYIGLLESFDEVSNTYTIMAIEGNKKEILDSLALLK